MGVRLMRLIDANEFQKQIAGMAILNNYPPNKANALCELIDSQSTAFDVEKVPTCVGLIGSSYSHDVRQSKIKNAMNKLQRKAIAHLNILHLSILFYMIICV